MDSGKLGDGRHLRDPGAHCRCDSRQDGEEQTQRPVLLRLRLRGLRDAEKLPPSFITEEETRALPASPGLKGDANAKNHIEDRRNAVRHV